MLVSYRPLASMLGRSCFFAASHPFVRDSVVEKQRSARARVARNFSRRVRAYSVRAAFPAFYQSCTPPARTAPMRLRLLAAAALATAQIYRPDGAQTQFKSLQKSVQRKISSSSHHISDGEHIKLDDGNLPSEIFLGRHTIKKPWTLGKYDNNVITVEDMYRIILKRRLFGKFLCSIKRLLRKFKKVF